MRKKDLLQTINNDKIANKINQAYEYTKKVLNNLDDNEKKEILQQILNTSQILIKYQADESTLISNILYPTLNFNDKIPSKYGEFTKKIVEKLQKFNLIQHMHININELNNLQQNSPEDFRVLFIILALQTYNLKYNSSLTLENKQNIAKLTLNYIIPYAEKLKINYINIELKDLCFSYLNPTAYNKILENLTDTRENLENSLNTMKQTICNLLLTNNVDFSITSRVKSIYSINSKIEKGKKFEEIFDILAIRIIVNNISDCSKVLQIIHEHYAFFPKRVKDYITNPKANMYQSLHTTIIDEKNKIYEIQIRTKEMDKVAEFGSASHEIYKKRQLTIQN